jgi:hypothetical protein
LHAAGAAGDQVLRGEGIVLDFPARCELLDTVLASVVDSSDWDRPEFRAN